MCEEVMIRHSSPTLAGMKTGCLVTYRFQDELEMRQCVSSWNRVIVTKGLRALPLRYRNGTALLYIYRVSSLVRDLQQSDAQEILLAKGYSCNHAQSCIGKLRSKLNQQAEFPHEIGLFLGYPPEDVRGFMENHASGYKHVGYWKVYGDKGAAERWFSRYKKCTSVYRTQYARGITIERLTVAG